MIVCPLLLLLLSMFFTALAVTGQPWEYLALAFANGLLIVLMWIDEARRLPR